MPVRLMTSLTHGFPSPAVQRPSSAGRLGSRLCRWVACAPFGGRISVRNARTADETMHSFIAMKWTGERETETGPRCFFTRPARHHNASAARGPSRSRHPHLNKRTHLRNVCLRDALSKASELLRRATKRHHASTNARSGCGRVRAASSSRPYPTRMQSRGRKRGGFAPGGSPGKRPHCDARGGCVGSVCRQPMPSVFCGTAGGWPGACDCGADALPVWRRLEGPCRRVEPVCRQMTIPTLRRLPSPRTPPGRTRSADRKTLSCPSAALRVGLRYDGRWKEPH
jgi:hypothetical protein